MKKWFAALLFIVLAGLFWHYNEYTGGPVDVVYTWVDGSDPQWLDVRAARALECGKEIVHKDANSSNRYRDRDELKYSLRSLDRYAPFVNHIFIVTCGQRPVWMKPHPKITFIDHSEIFQNEGHLPTFNSQAIEAHLHRIPGLSDRYIYLNDDFVFTRSVSVDNFYTPCGKIKVFRTKEQIPKDKTQFPDSSFRTSLANADQWLDRIFGTKMRRHIAHAPYVMRKCVVERFEAQYPDVFQLNSSHPFRSACDYTLTNGLIPYFALYTKQAVYAPMKTTMLLIGNNFQDNENQFEKLSNRRYKMVCIDDESFENDERINLQVKRNLEKKFPQRAPWER